MVSGLSGYVVNFLYNMNRCFIFRGRNKRGDMDIDEVIKIAFVVIIIVVMIVGVSVLFFGKGGRLFDSIKDLFRFGG